MEVLASVAAPAGERRADLMTMTPSTPTEAGPTGTESTGTGPNLPDLVCITGHRKPLWARIGMLIASGVLLTGALIIWLVPVVGGSWFLYVPGFILLGTASRRAGRWVNAAERKLPLRVRLWMRPREVRVAFAAATGQTQNSQAKAVTAGANDHRPAPREAAPAGDDRSSEGTSI